MTDYSRNEEIVVLDKRDALYGGTRRLVATLVPKVDPEPGPPPSPEPPKTESTLAPTTEPTTTPTPSLGPTSTPPGNGSRETWEAYAASLGLTVTDDLGRDEIRALVDEHTKES